MRSMVQAMSGTESSVMVDVAFWVCAVVAVCFGVLVFVVDSMARATYALALSFIATGGALLLMQQSYLGVIVVLMMVMEMAVMGVFMVMFMGMNPALMPMSMVHGQRTALAAGIGAFVLLAAGILTVSWPARISSAPSSGAVTRGLGEAIMGPKMLVMLTVSPVMLATIVAGVVLALARSRYDRLGDDLDQVPEDARPGGANR